MNSTIVTPLSPPGKSAIACLGIAGPESWTIVRSLFAPTPPESPTTPATFFGKLAGDDVILFARRMAPMPIVEIHSHGGLAVVRAIERALVDRGIQTADAETWIRATSDRPDWVAILAECSTTRTAAIALDQFHGALDCALAEIHELQVAGRDVEAAARISRLNELLPVGEHLVRPWRVALVGPPNVGKSSLVNALAGFTRSIVTPTPGTTRDVVSTVIALDGWPIELLDTAGQRETEETLEAAGIVRGKTASASADLMLRIVDATAPSFGGPLQVKEVVVINKIDVSDDDQVRRIVADLRSQISNLKFEISDCDKPRIVRVSATTGEGLADLTRAIVDRLVPHPPRPGEAVPRTWQESPITSE